jgi:hypothetical protein
MILHRIRAYLYDNPLTTGNKNDFMARVVSDRSLSVRDICEKARQRGGADVTAEAMVHAVELFLREMAYNLCDGYSVNLKWFVASPHIKGVFDAPDEQFNPEKHRMLFEFHQGLDMRRELERLQIKILGPAPVGPHIWQVEDRDTGSIDDIVSAARPLVIRGFNIRVAGTEPEVGVYFHALESTRPTYTVDKKDILTNNPSKLLIISPDLSPGTYRLEIITQYVSGGKSFVKEPRTNTFEKVLRVAPN